MTHLDAERIRRSLGNEAKDGLERFETFPEIDSTSTYLKQQTSPAPGRMHVAIADHQTAGRGRGQRQWISAPGSSLCLSMSYSFQKAPEMLPAVTLALGVGIAQALGRIGVGDLALKWPNDLLIGDGKLGGILTETQMRDRSDISLVAGVGINVATPEAIAGKFESAWAHAPVGLASAMREAPSRESLAANLIEAMFATFTAFDQHGFERFNADFEALDWLLGKHIVVDAPKGNVEGIAKGIDASGALLVDTDAGLRTFISGSILRAERRPAYS